MTIGNCVDEGAADFVQQTLWDGARLKMDNIVGDFDYVNLLRLVLGARANCKSMNGVQHVRIP